MRTSTDAVICRAGNRETEIGTGTGFGIATGTTGADATAIETATGTTVCRARSASATGTAARETSAGLVQKSKAWAGGCILILLGPKPR